MPVNSPNQEYSDNIDQWQLVRDCDKGAKAIKSRSIGGDGSKTLRGTKGTAYLPAPNASDTSNENQERYFAYLERANFVNFTGHTKEGMLGMVFRKKTVIEAPADIEYLIENANGGGLSTDQMVKDVAGDVLMLGRYGLLVDYPGAAKGLTDAEVKALNLRANILPYPAESIISWRTETIGGVTKLSMVVLKEPTEIQDPEDQFKTKIENYHRVLLLKDGVYVQNLYDEENNIIVYKTGETDNDGEEILTGDIIPRDHTGKEWAEIPFAFAGSVNNDETVDKAPLYDIAEINIAHYRNSADYEESSFLVGQPTPVISGLTQGWVDTNMKEGVTLGSRGAILTPEGGSATLLQAAENQMPLKGMEIKELQMIMVGTRIIQDKGGNETAEGAKIRFAGQNSKLGSLITNVENAFLKCYGWAQMFMGGSGEILIDVNKEFYDSTLDPQMVIAQIQLLDRGVIAVKDLRDNLRKSNFIDSNRTDEMLDSEAETASPII